MIKPPLSANKSKREGEAFEHPGHTLDNVELESWGNNQAQNHEQDTPFIARGKKMAVDFEREAKPSRWGNRKIQSRSNWPKGRKIQSRGWK